MKKNMSLFFGIVAIITAALIFGSCEQSTSGGEDSPQPAQVAAPTVDVGGADQTVSVAPNTGVTLSTATEGALIRYTLDGSDPTNGTLYTEGTPVSLGGDAKTVNLKAIAWKEGTASPILTATYIVSAEAPAVPTVSLPGGTVGTGTDVTLNTEEEGGILYRVLGGTAPVNDWTPYTAETPISISGENGAVVTLEVSADSEGAPSDVVRTVEYKIGTTTWTAAASPATGDTTAITISFPSGGGDGLKTEHITLIEKDSKVTKGELSGSAPYTLGITIGDSGTFEVTVRIKKEGVVSEPTGGPVTVTKAAPGMTWMVGNDGEENTKTSQNISFIFDEELISLTDDEVALSGLEDIGAESGAINGSGKSWYIPISGITKAGTVSVTINKEGIAPGPKPVTLQKDTTAPGAVSGLEGVAEDEDGNPSATEIILSWDDPEDTYEDIDYFEIQVSSDGGETWTAKGTVELGEEGYTATGLTPSTTYNFRVRAVDNDENEGEWEETEDVTTPGSPAIDVDMPPYQAPVDATFTLSGIDENTILYWHDSTKVKVTVTGAEAESTYKWALNGDILVGETTSTLDRLSNDFVPGKDNTLTVFVTDKAGVTYSKSVTFKVEVQQPKA